MAFQPPCGIISGDGAEVAQSSDPADASDGGVPDSRVAVPFTFGDHSESHSEKYVLDIRPEEGAGAPPRSLSWLNARYGTCETKTAMLKPDWRYSVTLRHAATDPGYVNIIRPDYDYTLEPVTNGLPPMVAFSDGASTWVEFAANAMIPRAVRRADLRWEWKVSRMGGHDVAGFACATTGPHRVYTVLDVPTAPWVPNGMDVQNPWTDALELACTVAEGVDSPTLIASLVTTMINNSGRFAYEIRSGESCYTSGNSVFLSSCIDRIKGFSGRGAFVNCTDCASFVVSFSNLLGCELYSSRMGFNFMTNPYTAIGRNMWTPPQWGWGFSYHEVAWDGECGDYDKVYDACLQYDCDENPFSNPRIEGLPVAIQFSDGNPTTPFVYRDRLASPDVQGYEKCISRPMSRIRRNVK